MSESTVRFYGRIADCVSLEVGSEDTFHDLRGMPDRFRVTSFALLERNGEYRGEFIGEIPREYTEKEVSVSVSYNESEGVGRQTIRIEGEGLKPLVSELSLAA